MSNYATQVFLRHFLFGRVATSEERHYKLEYTVPRKIWAKVFPILSEMVLSLPYKMHLSPWFSNVAHAPSIPLGPAPKLFQIGKTKDVKEFGERTKAHVDSYLKMWTMSFVVTTSGADMKADGEHKRSELPFPTHVIFCIDLVMTYITKFRFHFIV